MSHPELRAHDTWAANDAEHDKLHQLLQRMRLVGELLVQGGRRSSYVEAAPPASRREVVLAEARYARDQLNIILAQEPQADAVTQVAEHERFLTTIAQALTQVAGRVGEHLERTAAAGDPRRATGEPQQQFSGPDAEGPAT